MSTKMTLAAWVQSALGLRTARQRFQRDAKPATAQPLSTI